MKPKKLVKPITLLIEIRVRTWWDKANGYTYCSARVVVNGDYDAEILIPFQNYSVNECYRHCIEAVIEQYLVLAKRLPRQAQYSISDGVYINRTVEECTLRDCKNFGERS